MGTIKIWVMAEVTIIGGNLQNFRLPRFSDSAMTENGVSRASEFLFQRKRKAFASIESLAIFLEFGVVTCENKLSVGDENRRMSCTGIIIIGLLYGIASTMDTLLVC